MERSQASQVILRRPVSCPNPTLSPGYGGRHQLLCDHLGGERHAIHSSIIRWQRKTPPPVRPWAHTGLTGNRSRSPGALVVTTTSAAPWGCFVPCAPPLPLRQLQPTRPPAPTARRLHQVAPGNSDGRTQFAFGKRLCRTTRPARRLAGQCGACKFDRLSSKPDPGSASRLSTRPMSSP